MPDGDFIDVDWERAATAERNGRCCIALHGLEGHSGAPYIKSLARAFGEAGYTVGALNLRGCSGEPNRLNHFYHSGETEGLAFIVETLARRFEAIYLVGFSLGGNAALKYLGEDSSRVPDAVRGAVAFSVPCHLASAADCLAEPRNRFYMKRFIRMLCAKLEQKSNRYPKYVYEPGCCAMQSFHEFDEVYTAPLNGFDNAQHYWTESSCIRYLDRIDRPALLINARNDPFLSSACFPIEIAQVSDRFFLEMPRSGGHCGFPGARSRDGCWHERRALSFFGRF